MGKVADPSCIYCGSAKDDVHHTFFVCERWQEERSGLEDDVGRVTPEDIVPVMLVSIENWGRIANFAEDIRKRKKADLP